MVVLLMFRSVGRVLGSSIRELATSSPLKWGTRQLHATFTQYSQQDGKPPRPRLASLSHSPQMMALKQYVKPARVPDTKHYDFPHQLNIKRNDPISEVTWHRILAFGAKCGEDQLDKVVLGLSSLPDEEFEKADGILLSGQETVVDRLHLLLKKRLHKEGKAFRDWRPRREFLFQYGSLLCKIRKETRMDLFRQYFGKLYHQFPSLSKAELLTICRFVGVDKGCPRPCTNAMEKEVQSRHKELSPEVVGFFAWAYCIEAHIKLSLASMEVVAMKAQEWLAVASNWESLPRALTPDQDVSAFHMLLDSLYFSCMQFDSLQQMEEIQGLILDLIRDFLSALGKGAQFPHHYELLFLRSCKHCRVPYHKLKRFFSWLTQNGHLLSSEVVATLSFPAQVDIANSLQYYPELDCLESILDKIESGCVSRLQEDPSQFHSALATRDGSALLPTLAHALVLHGGFPKPLLEYVLSPEFCQIDKFDWGDGAPIMKERAERELCQLLYFLDCSIQLLHPDSGLPRVPQSVIKHLKNCLKKQKEKNLSRENDRAIAGGAHGKMLNEVEEVLVDLGVGLFQRGRLLPHFDVDDILIQFGSNGQPLSFKLDSNIRHLELEELRLNNRTRGLVLTMGTRLANSFELLQKRKAEQLELLGYRVEKIDIRDWLKDGGWDRKRDLARILSKHGMA